MRHPLIEWPITVEKGPKKDPYYVPSQKHIENTAALLDAYGVVVRHNLMRHQLEVTIPGFEVDDERAENTTLARIIELAERNGLCEKQMLSHIQVLAQSYHPVWDWIKSAPWDGRDRVYDLKCTMTTKGNSDLHGLLIDRWLAGCVRAVMPRGPGDTFRPQGVLTLQGAQGMGKSRWLEKLAPKSSGWVLTGAALDPHDRDSLCQLTSVWIVELGELDGTLNRSDIAAIKAFVDRPADTYRRPYARTDERIPRRTMMAASVNPRLFLADETGSRRWWAIPVATIDADHDIDMQQMWAQVRVLVEDGATWWLTTDEQAALSANNEGHSIIDPLISDLWETYQAGDAYDRKKISEIWSILRPDRLRQRKDALMLSNALEHYRNDKLLDGQATYRVCLRVPEPQETRVSH